MDVQNYKVRQDQKRKNQRDNKSWGNLKERPGKEVDVVWACDAKVGLRECGWGLREGGWAV